MAIHHMVQLEHPHKSIYFGVYSVQQKDCICLNNSVFYHTTLSYDEISM